MTWDRQHAKAESAKGGWQHPFSERTYFGRIPENNFQKEEDMSIMVDLPPAMAQEAQEYATVRGTTLERMLYDCIAAELERHRKRNEDADRMMAKWREVVRKGRGRLEKPYKFNRVDAYPEGEFS